VDVDGVGPGDFEGFGLGGLDGLGFDRLGLAEAVGLGGVEGCWGSTGGAMLGRDGRAGAECLRGLDGVGAGVAMGDVEGVRTTTRAALGLEVLEVEEPIATATASPPSASTVAAAEVITMRFTEPVLLSGLPWPILRAASVTFSAFSGYSGYSYRIIAVYELSSGRPGRKDRPRASSAMTWPSVAASRAAWAARRRTAVLRESTRGRDFPARRG
jgi:hypothetical protein